MKKYILTLLSILLAATSTLQGANDTFIDYQNYNHGYCPDCNCYPCRCGEGEPGTPPAAPAAPPAPAASCAPVGACAPPATVCATNCGISLWWVGLIVAGVAAAGAIVIGAD